MKVKVTLLLGVLLFTGAVAFAEDGTVGYFATTPNNPNPNINGPWAYVAAGAFDNPGPYVDVASITIPAGKYLLTVRLNTWSYMGGASVDCGVYVNHADPPAAWERLNGSGDGTTPGHDKATAVGKLSTLTGGLLTVSCLKTYGATQYSWVNATLTAVKVGTLKSN